MNDTMLQNLTYFEQAILFLLAFVAVYFVYLAIRDYRTSVNIRRLSGKVRELITGKYTEDIIIEKDRDLAELADQLNDLSTVFRLAQENLAQEKNRLASILSYMTDGSRQFQVFLTPNHDNYKYYQFLKYQQYSSAKLLLALN